MTDTNLIDAITSVDNMTQAWRQVRRNIRVAQRRSSRGSDDMTIHDFEQQWVAAMEQLALELRSGTYRPLPPRHLFLPKRDGGQRTIAIMAVRDRIAQRAVLQVLEPIIDPTFQDCSYGFRPNLSVPYALARVERYRNHDLHWAIHADIHDCFGSIDHQVLLRALHRHIADDAVLALIEGWLQVGMLSDVGTVDATHWWDAGADLLDHLVEWGTETALQPAQGYGLLLPATGTEWPDVDDDEIERPVRLRRRAVRGVASNLAMLGLAYGKPAVAGLRRVAPLISTQRRGRVAVRVAGLAALSLVPLVHRRRTERQRGTLQGGALSPLLANIYLDQFDRGMLERGHTLVRYADDLLLLGRDQAAVERAFADAEKLLHRLHLRFNPDKTRQASFADGVEFLGHQFPATAKSGPQWTSFRAAERALRAAQPQRSSKRRS